MAGSRDPQRGLTTALPPERRAACVAQVLASLEQLDPLSETGDLGGDAALGGQQARRDDLLSPRRRKVLSHEATAAERGGRQAGDHSPPDAHPPLREDYSVRSLAKRIRASWITSRRRGHETRRCLLCPVGPTLAPGRRRHRRGPPAARPWRRPRRGRRRQRPTEDHLRLHRHSVVDPDVPRTGGRIRHR